MSESYGIRYQKKGKERALPDFGYSFIEDNAAQEGFIWDGEELSWQDKMAGRLVLDFLSATMRFRMAHINKQQEPLLRAIGWKGGTPLSLCDLTAGLGRDASLFLFSGCTVTMFERNPILQVLLTFALEKFSQEMPDLATALSLQKMDALTFLTQSPLNNVEVLYMDPMYPERKKSALVKKELRIIRNLVGSDQDSAALLSAAIKSGVERVVVKRPVHADYVGNFPPHHTIVSPNTRFDVYMAMPN